jgi:hypothetical protein
MRPYGPGNNGKSNVPARPCGFREVIFDDSGGTATATAVSDVSA